MNLYTVRAKYSDGVDTKERKWAPPSDEGLEVYFRPNMELTLLCSWNSQIMIVINLYLIIPIINKG